MISVAAALILKNSTFLVAQRAKGELAGYWEFPGGRIEPGETPEQAVVREIEEELVIQVAPTKIEGTFRHTYSFADVELTLVRCEMVDSDQHIGSDGSHASVRWITTQETSLKFAPLDEKIMTYLKGIK